jgi:predicted dinucleotide-binding enzyme
MRVAVIGTGPIGGTLGRAFARGGHQVVFGSRHPEGSSAAGDTSATVASAEAAVKGSEVVVLALPGTAVDEFLDACGPLLADRLVVDATNRITAKVPNGLESVRDKAPGARYARAAPVRRAGRTAGARPSSGVPHADRSRVGDSDEHVR